MRVWGKSNHQIASQAELLAVSKILPQLGFSEVYHLSSVNYFFPFDIVATFRNERVLVDVTTGMGKSLKRQRIIAGVLRMKFFVLFVKPDLKAYYLSKEDSDNVSYHTGEVRRIA